MKQNRKGSWASVIYICFVLIFVTAYITKILIITDTIALIVGASVLYLIEIKGDKISMEGVRK